MDPNETLKELLHDTWLLSNLEVSDGIDDSLVELTTRVANHTAALNDWLSKGGFLPDAWRQPLVPAFGVNPIVDELLWTVFVVALEGGITYWAVSNSYHFENDNGTIGGAEDHEGFYSDIVDADPDAGSDNFPPTRIDRTVIARAFERMAAGPIEYMPDGQRHKFLAQLHAALGGRTPDFDFDAGDADNAVQVGVLGSVVFS